MKGFSLIIQAKNTIRYVQSPKVQDLKKRTDCDNQDILVNLKNVPMLI